VFDQKKWYADNREEQRAKARVRSQRYRDFLIKLRTLILSATPCMDCGAPPDEDFEFDHRINIGAKAQSQ
jgi:hypothetical protein